MAKSDRVLAKQLVVDFIADRFPDPRVIGTVESDGAGGFAVTVQILVSDLDIEQAKREAKQRSEDAKNGVTPW